MHPTSGNRQLGGGAYASSAAVAVPTTEERDGSIIPVIGITALNTNALQAPAVPSSVAATTATSMTNSDTLIPRGHPHPRVPGGGQRVNILSTANSAPQPGCPPSTGRTMAAPLPVPSVMHDIDEEDIDLGIPINVPDPSDPVVTAMYTDTNRENPTSPLCGMGAWIGQDQVYRWQ